jgi:N utilization substance protein A
MVASPDILNALRELTNAKQLDRNELKELLQDGIYAALAKKYGPTVQAEVDIDETSGGIRIVLLKTVVEEVTDAAREISLEEARFEDEEFQVGDILEQPVEFAEFGRAAVQAAKQRIISASARASARASRTSSRRRSASCSRARSADRARQARRHAEQVPRGGGDHPLPRAEPPRALPPGRDDPRRAQAGRGHPQGAAPHPEPLDALFVQALFKLEVPRSSRGSSRSGPPAARSGAAPRSPVFSRDDSVDPVGACVGLKGARVQAVVNELGGERIDIVPWSADPERFAKLALAPAKVARVFSDPARAPSRRSSTRTSCRSRSAATGRTSAWPPS